MGLAYGVALTTLGIVSSGGGHSNLILMLAVAPYGTGLLVWPMLGFTTGDLRTPWSRRIFLLLTAFHYVGYLTYVVQNWESEVHWLTTAISYDSFVITSLFGLMFYVVGQVFLWSTFWKTRSP